METPQTKLNYYRHNKNGKLYYTIGDGKAKIKQDKKWVDIIIYYCAYINPDGQVWVRFEKDFIDNFKKESDGQE